MPSGQFSASAEGMASLAAAFGDAAHLISLRSSAFGDQAVEIGDGFGLLAECAGVAGTYESMMRSTARALGQLARVLKSDETTLSQTDSDGQAGDAATETVPAAEAVSA